MHKHKHSKQKGMTLIELMVSMTLGLLIIGAVVSVAVASMKTHKSVKAISKIQENSRFAYEFMAREIREAGGLLCNSNNYTIVNVLKNSPDNDESGVANDAWASFTPVVGFQEDQAFSGVDFGSEEGDRIAGTDAMKISFSDGNGYRITDHNPPSAQFKIEPANSDMVPGDILIACDYTGHAAIFQMTGPNAFNNEVVHNTGASVSPGNCSKGLGFPTVCSATGTPHDFSDGGFIAKYSANYWYVGCNGRHDCSKPAGRSLYFTSQKAGVNREIEVVDSVIDMQIKYAERGSDHYDDADDVVNWSSVDSMEVNITFGDEIDALDAESSGDILRSFTYVIALRNRQS